MNRKYALLLVVPLLAFAANAHATVTLYDTVMSGPNESPANASPGTGIADFAYNDSVHTFFIDMSFSGLTGTTTASHIHAATAVPFTSTAGVATTTPYFAGFPIGVTSGSFSITLDLTQSSSWNPSYVSANGGTNASAEAAFISAINTGKAYLNVHSSTFGGGEIRGFLVPTVPEPATCALAALGAAAVGCVVRRR